MDTYLSLSNIFELYNEWHTGSGLASPGI
jgi:hypothetical protein